MTELDDSFPANPHFILFVTTICYKTGGVSTCELKFHTLQARQIAKEAIKASVKEGQTAAAAQFFAEFTGI